MSYSGRTVTYPYLLMNHLALMLIALKYRLFFNKQAEAIFGMPIQVMSPNVCPDNNRPIAMICKSPEIRQEFIW